MDFGLKRAFKSCRLSIDGNPIPSARDSRDAESLSLEPCDDLIQIVCANTKALRILLRRQPVMIVRGTGGLLVFE